MASYLAFGGLLTGYTFRIADFSVSETTNRLRTIGRSDEPSSFTVSVSVEDVVHFLGSNDAIPSPLNSVPAITALLVGDPVDLYHGVLPTVNNDNPYVNQFIATGIILSATEDPQTNLIHLEVSSRQPNDGFRGGQPVSELFSDDSTVGLWFPGATDRRGPAYNLGLRTADIISNKFPFGSSAPGWDGQDPWGALLEASEAYGTALLRATPGLLTPPQMVLSYPGYTYDHIRYAASGEDSLWKGGKILDVSGLQVSQDRVTWSSSFSSDALSTTVHQYSDPQLYVPRHQVWPPITSDFEEVFFTVSAGGVSEYTLDLTATVRSLAPIVHEYTPTPITTAVSKYSVMTDSGTYIDPETWSRLGGSVSATLEPDSKTVTLRLAGPRGILDRDKVPVESFTLAAVYDGYDGLRQYPAMYLAGTGMWSEPEEIVIPTGRRARSLTELPNRLWDSADVLPENRFLSSRDQGYKLLTRVARSRRPKGTPVSRRHLPEVASSLANARYYDDRYRIWFRVVSSQITPDGTNLEGEYDTRWSDVEKFRRGRTYGQVQAMFDDAALGEDTSVNYRVMDILGVYPFEEAPPPEPSYDTANVARVSPASGSITERVLTFPTRPGEVFTVEASTPNSSTRYVRVYNQGDLQRTASFSLGVSGRSASSLAGLDAHGTTLAWGNTLGTSSIPSDYYKGRVYFFQRNSSGDWVRQTEYLSHPFPEQAPSSGFDYFGAQIALNGEWLAISGRSSVSQASGGYVVFIYRSNGSGGWDYVQTLTSPEVGTYPSPSNRFGATKIMFAEGQLFVHMSVRRRSGTDRNSYSICVFSLSETGQWVLSQELFRGFNVFGSPSSSFDVSEGLLAYSATDGLDIYERGSGGGWSLSETIPLSDKVRAPSGSSSAMGEVSVDKDKIVSAQGVWLSAIRDKNTTVVVLPRDGSESQVVRVTQDATNGNYFGASLATFPGGFWAVDTLTPNTSTQRGHTARVTPGVE